MARVFVSHAREDLALAFELHQWLVDDGHEVFLDQDLRDGIAVGEHWKQQLYERLRWTNAVVCVVTSAYLASQWCTAEVSIALSRGNRLLPVRAESGVTHALLQSVQHTDLAENPAAARAAVAEALSRVDAAGDPEWPDDRSPFPGLRPLDIDRHRVFFGRSTELDQLTELLRSMAEHNETAALLVVGPSGCGKSSLARAGLLPAMAGEPGWWTLPPMVPGTDPVATLAYGLTEAAARIGLEWTADHVSAQLDQVGFRKLAEKLLLAAPGSPQRLLIVVDQFEELLTQTGPTERARFTHLLRSALTGPVQVVATLRSELLDHLLAAPELSALPTQVHTLRPLRHEALRVVIEQPARLAGIGVDEHLVARLIDDTGRGDALPLLAFTLAQLADGIRRGGQLSRARYEELGGVRGALTREADAALADAVAAGGRSREQVIAGLLRLVSINEQGHPTPWRVSRDELPASVASELDVFVARRLLTTDTENDQVVVGVAHEAFLFAWSPLTEAITANATALRARRTVERAAIEWHDNGRPLARLWGGGQLASAVADIDARIYPDAASAPEGFPVRRRPPALVIDVVDLTSKARDFLRASIRHDRYRRRRTVTVLSVLLSLALVAAGIALIKQRDAQEQLRTATARQLIAQAGGVRDTDPRTALQLAVAAESIDPGGESRIGLFNILAATRYTGVLTAHTDYVDSVAFSPDGHTLATSGSLGTVFLWDIANPAKPRQLRPPLTDPISSSSVTFSPDGHILVVASRSPRSLNGGNDGTLFLWDVTNPAQPRQLSPRLTQPGLSSVAFSPDGHTMATAGTDGAVLLWDLTNPAQPRQLGPPFTAPLVPPRVSPPDAVYSVAFSPDAHTLATAIGRTAIGGGRADDGTVMLWDLTNPAQPRQIAPPFIAHTRPVYSVAFSPQGRTLVTGSGDGEGAVKLWDLTNPVQPRQLGLPLTAHTGGVTSVVFSPDGRALVTGGNDRTVRLWDIGNPAQPRQLGLPLTAHTGSVTSVAFSPDGHTLATGGYDRRVFLWDLTNPAQPRQLGLPLTAHNGEVSSVAYSPDGHTLATGGVDYSTDPAHYRIDYSVRLWDVTSPAQPRPLRLPFTAHTGVAQSVAFSPDGHILATGGADFRADDTVVLWDLSDPAQPRQLGPPLAHTDSVRSVALSPDGHILATGGADRGADGDLKYSVRLWDVTSPAQPRQLGSPLIAHTREVTSVVFSPDGHTLATSSADYTVRLWDITDPVQPGELGLPITAHTGSVQSVVFAPDGHTLATASDDQTVILWDLNDPTQPQRLGPPLTAHTVGVTSVTFSPDGHTLATASADGTVLLWDVTNLGQPRLLGQPLTGHIAAVSSVAFSPNGRTLATGSSDHTVILWDVTELNYTRDHVIGRACAIARGGLDRDEWARYIPALPYQDTCPG